MHKLVIFIFCIFFLPSVQARESLLVGPDPFPAMLYAEARDQRDESNAANQQADEEDKKCMTICKQWGEHCIINPVTGKRDCRRICKEFGEECF
ncbi:MAG: hypothetical protein GWO08_00270 [Gammaproteobacteria bacterium]|nr:hypothetical protein [Gammaproteobacteria bacterium]NIN61780.1 hypothetical protein [Gammaproteobacteria bacterium]NIO62930.1 hypothetical protein [Gammaproteobacteria bacterium]NIQ08178.1 hypothetical protein [Gammaproteobacteria bacterium]NIQ19494.1 hypothetical protein [Gammaproteobacteria bacterium]